VLERWLEGAEAPIAGWLDLVLYSREALQSKYEESAAAHEKAKSEAEAKGETYERPAPVRDVPDADWAVVSVNAELDETETPIKPMTQMRNALGKAYGGSGVPLDPVAYSKAVEYWSDHASIR